MCEYLKIVERPHNAIINNKKLLNIIEAKTEKPTKDKYLSNVDSITSNTCLIFNLSHLIFGWMCVCMFSLFYLSVSLCERMLYLILCKIYHHLCMNYVMLNLCFCTIYCFIAIFLCFLCVCVHCVR